MRQVPVKHRDRAAVGPPSPDGGWSHELVELGGAVVVPPVESGLIQPCGVPGADEKFCQHSATWRAGRQMMTAPPQPENVAKTLNGRHLFAGQLVLHFGPFIAESMSLLGALEHLAAPPVSSIFIPKRPARPTVNRR